MDTQRETFYVDGYKAGIELQFQQMENRLLPVIDGIGSQTGEFEYFDRMGTGTVKKVTGRFTDVEYTESQYDRRGIVTEKYYGAELVDDVDKLRMLNDPTNSILTNFMNAMKRQMEDCIIRAATADAHTEVAGVKGTTAFPATQTIAVNYVRSGTATNSGLTKDKIIAARTKLIQKEVVEPDEEIYGVISQEELNDLLYISEFTSADYNTQRSLATGVPVSWLGVTWIRSERLLKNSSNYRRCLFMPKGAIMFNMRGSVTGDIDKVSSKHPSVRRVYLSAEFGAVRKWEEKIVEVLSNS